MRRALAHLALSAALCLGLAAGAETGPDAASEPPSEAKRQLILELIALSGGQAAAEQLVEVTLAQLEAGYDTMLEEVLRSETELDADEQELLRAHLGDYERFSKAFRARLPERIDMDEILEAAYLPLYHQSFSEEELGEIVAFYHTPTGQKVLLVLPDLLQEGMRRTLPLVQPQVMTVVGEVLAAQRAELFD